MIDFEQVTCDVGQDLVDRLAWEAMVAVRDLMAEIANERLLAAGRAFIRELRAHMGDHDMSEAE